MRIDTSLLATGIARLSNSSCSPAVPVNEKAWVAVPSGRVNETGAFTGIGTAAERSISRKA